MIIQNKEVALEEQNTKSVKICMIIFKIVKSQLNLQILIWRVTTEDTLSIFCLHSNRLLKCTHLYFILSISYNY